MQAYHLGGRVLENGEGGGPEPGLTGAKASHGENIVGQPEKWRPHLPLVQMPSDDSDLCLDNMSMDSLFSNRGLHLPHLNTTILLPKINEI